MIIANSIDLLPAIEIETGAYTTHAIIWLHGLGADGNDFVSIIDELELAPKKSMRFIFPHAPERPVSINNGHIMRAWYNIVDSDFSKGQDEAGILSSQKSISALITRQIQRGIDSKNVFLAGFSQGGAMALQVGLRQTNPLAGIIALSCYLPLAGTFSSQASSANAETPIFMAHGTYDPIIPISHAIASKKKLQAANYNLEWHEYPIPHTVCKQEIRDINRWLKHVADNNNRP